MESELRCCEQTVHVNIPKTYELLQDEENYYIINEYISGGTLKDKVNSQIIQEHQAAHIVK
jgi:serine/threonine protein kinase